MWPCSCTVLQHNDVVRQLRTPTVSNTLTAGLQGCGLPTAFAHIAHRAVRRKKSSEQAHGAFATQCAPERGLTPRELPQLLVSGLSVAGHTFWVVIQRIILAWRT